MQNQETAKSRKLMQAAKSMMDQVARGVTGVADIVLAIDATNSMSPLMQAVRENALAFYPMIVSELKAIGRELKKLRIKVIVFRDVYVDAEPFVDSGFFELPEQAEAFRAFVMGVMPIGGGDEPESGLEALSMALGSRFMNVMAEGASFQRQIIAVMTDASAHSLEDERRARMEEKGLYPQGIAKSLKVMRDSLLVDSEEPTGMHPAALRIALFTPNAYPWNEVAGWPSNVTACWSQAGTGLGQAQFKELIAFIVKSMSLK